MGHFVRCEACEAYRENEILRKASEEREEESKLGSIQSILGRTNVSWESYGEFVAQYVISQNNHLPSVYVGYNHYDLH